MNVFYSILGCCSGILLLVAQSSMAQNWTFPDIPADYPHAKAIEYVQTEGIVSGNPDGNYAPHDAITRAAFTKIIIHTNFSREAIADCDTSTLSFSDVAPAAWYASYICVGVQAGIISGYPDGTFRPSDSVNTVEASKIIVGTIQEMRAGNPWYKPYVHYASDLKILPIQVTSLEQEITRGVMAEMIFRLMTGENTQSYMTYTLLGGE